MINEILKKLILDVLEEASKVAGKDIYITTFPDEQAKESLKAMLLEVIGKYGDYSIEDPDMDKFKEGYNQAIDDVLKEEMAKLDKLFGGESDE